MRLPYTASLRPELIESEVEFEHVDPRLPPQAERPAFDQAVHQRADTPFWQVAGLGHARHLEEGRFRRDVGVEATTRRGHQIDLHGRPSILGLELVNVALDPLG